MSRSRPNQGVLTRNRSLRLIRMSVDEKFHNAATRRRLGSVAGRSHIGSIAVQIGKDLPTGALRRCGGLSDLVLKSDKNVSRETLLSGGSRKPYNRAYAARV